MFDLRWFVGTVFVIFAAGLLQINCPIWALFPAVTGVYILGSHLYDKLKF